MAGLWFFQRHAAESLLYPGDTLPIGVEYKKLFLNDGTTLHPLGISPGYGTCSQKHNIDILIVSLINPQHGKITVKRSAKKCSCAQLLFRPKNQKGHEPARMILERLELVSVDAHEAIFARTHRIKEYVSLC